MMWYNGPRHHRYYRRYRGGRFPWMLLPILVFFFTGSHLFWLVLFGGLVVAFLLFVIQRIAWSTTSGRNQQQTSSYNVPPYYQPPAQNNAPQYYEPYYQGYRPTPERSPAPEYYTPEKQQDDPYQAYDQPKAEYPQQMPPM